MSTMIGEQRRVLQVLCPFDHQSMIQTPPVQIDNNECLRWVCGEDNCGCIILQPYLYRENAPPVIVSGADNPNGFI